RPTNTLQAVNMESLEEYHSPFDFEQGVNSSYLYLSPACSDTPPSSPAVRTRGNLKHPDSIPEVGEDAATSVGPSPAPPAMTQEEQQELQEKLVKVEDEILTLSQVLAAKEKQLADIKRKLGITPLNELKQNFTKTWQEVTTSTAYRRTSETLSQASLKATAAFSNVGSAITRKLEDVSLSSVMLSDSTRSLQHSASMPAMRNAQTFKSFEEKVETLKSAVGESLPA
uniref:Tumor protein D52 n=1 Tax=Gasterosteus aculeatus TaxID=69293 RepID=G3NGP2_GASAC